MRILLVEDDAVLGDGLSRSLGDWGFDVTLAETGACEQCVTHSTLRLVDTGSWATGYGRLVEVAKGSFLGIQFAECGLVDWPLWRSATVKFGSPGDRPPLRFVAGKQAIKFRFPKAACRH